MSSEAEKLLTWLDRHRKEHRRQKLETVIEAYYHTFPERRERADQRDQIKRLLVELEESGALILPKGTDCWQTMPMPALPLWIRWPPEPASPAPKPDHRTFPWVSELRFVASLPVLRDPEAVRKIHDFLKVGGRSRPLVPVKERSWGLFGDEKALDSIKKGPLFKPGRLTLEHLRCFEVAASLPCRPGPPGASGPWLIVENEATFDSFARWNREAKRHRGVILGNGFAVHRAEAFLFDLLEGEGAGYFGDLDVQGCQIPYDLSRRYSLKSTYYEWLLEACQVPEVAGPTDDARPWLRWFPDNLRKRVLCATQLPKPPAQEAIGWEWLIRQGACAV
jgi:hypothetical protein